MEAAILDPAKLKLLEAFLELSTSSSSQWVPTIAPIEGDISEIITNLLKLAKYIFAHMTLIPASPLPVSSNKVIGPTVDYVTYLQIVSDICSCVLLLSSHQKFTKELGKTPSLVLCTLEALDQCSDPENASKLVQAVSLFASSNASVYEFSQQRGFERLITTTRRKEMASIQLSVLSKIAEIIARYPEPLPSNSFPSPQSVNQTSTAAETMSQAPSRSGRASPQMQSLRSSPRDMSLTHRDRDVFSTKNSVSMTPRPRTPSQFSLATGATGAPPPGIAHSTAAETLASKGYKMAVNMMGGLIQMTPISTAWRRGEHDALGKARAAQDEEALLVLESLALSNEAILDEEERVKFILQEKVRSSEPATAEEITSTLDSLLDFKRSTSNIEDSGGSALLADAPLGKRSISLDASENRRLEIETNMLQSAINQQAVSHPPSTDVTNVPKLIRNQVLEQGVLTSLMESMSFAATRAQVCDVLHIAETLLHHNAAAQSAFQAQDGYVLLATMIVKVEIELLAGQQMSSQAASPTMQGAASATKTPGQSEWASATLNLSRIQSTDASSCSGNGGGGVPKKGADTEREEFIQTVGRLLLAIILDEPFNKINLKPTSSLFGAGSTNNIPSVTSLVYLLRSKSYVALSIGAKVMFSLLKMNPMNVVMMQTVGVTEELYKTFSHLVVSGPDALIDFERQMADHYADSTSGAAEGDEDEGERSSDIKAFKDILKLKSPKSMLSNEVLTIYEKIIYLVSDFALLVQYTGVVTSYKDCSILAYLTHLTLSLTVLFSENHGIVQLKYKPQIDMKKTFETPGKVESDWYSRCQNCDTEDATVECVHESCSKLKCLKLCRECDKVFHKAIAKRAHIRLPIAENMLSESFSKLAKLENSSVSTAVRETERWLEHTSQNAQKPRGMGGSFDSDFVGSPGGSIFLDSVISILLGSIRGLIDDRRARSQALPPDLIEPMLIALRVLVTIPPSYVPQKLETTNMQNSSKMSSMQGSQGSKNKTQAPVLNSGSSPNPTATDDVTRVNKLEEDFSKLADSRFDVDTTGGYDFLFSSNFELCEDDCSSGAPRRVALSLFVQVITRFILLDEDESFTPLGAVSGPQLSQATAKDKSKDLATLSSASSVMFSFRKLGGDALLIHLLLDDSKAASTTASIPDKTPFVQLLMSDRQAILWCLRECVVSANMLPMDDASVEILRWILWALNAPLTAPKHSGNRPKSLDSKSSRQLTLESSRTGASMIPASASSSSLVPALGGTALLTRTSSQSAYALRSKGIKFATFPMSRPAISLQLRLLIVQELRCLLSGDELDSPFATLKSSAFHVMSLPIKQASTATKDTRKPSSDALKQLQRTYSQELNPAPLSRTSSWRNGVNLSTSMVSLQSDNINLGHAAPTSTLLSSSGVLARVPGNVGSIRSLFVKAGAVETLFKVTFGDLSSGPIKTCILSGIHGSFESSLSTATKTSSSSTATSLNHGSSVASSKWAEDATWELDGSEALEDTHMEDWLNNLTLLWEILCNNDEAKSALEQLVPLPQVISCLFSLTRDVCIDRSDTPITGFQISAHTYSANNLLLDMIMELCITNGRCTTHRKSFVGCSLKHSSFKAAPALSGRSTQGQLFVFDRVMEIGMTEGAGGSKKQPQQSSQQQTHKSNWRMKLFQYIVKNVTAFHDLNDGFEPRSTFISSLSPVYFVKDRTLCHMVSIMTPLQLAFKHDSLTRRSLLIQTFNSTGPSASVTTPSINPSVFGLWANPITTASGSATSQIGNIEPELLPKPLAEGISDNISVSSQNRKRSNSMRRLQNSTSLQSFNDLGATQVTEAWENESVAPSVQSYQSQNSLVAFANAIKGGNDFHPSSASVRGDMTPLSVGASRSYRRVDSLGPAFDGAVTPINLVPSLRPPFTVPLLDSLGWTMGSVQTKLLMIVHGALLYKSGMTVADLNIDDDDANMPDCGDVSETQTAVGDSVSVSAALRPIQAAGIMTLPRIQFLRKQLAIFTTNNKADKKGSLLKSYDSSSTSHTAFSRLQFRSYACAESFLTLALSARDDSQMFLLTFLSNVVDGNPVNSRMLVKDTDAPVKMLIQLMPHLQEKQKSTVSHLLSQFLCYHVSSTSIEQLSRVVKSGRIKSIFKALSENPDNKFDLDNLVKQISQSEANKSDEESDQSSGKDGEGEDTTNQVLYVLGRSAKRKNPAQFLHFDQSSPLASGVLLNPIKSLPGGSTGYSIHCWLRLGSLGAKPTSNLMQVSVRNNVTGSYEVFALDLFFRIIYKAIGTKGDIGLNSARRRENSVPSFDAAIMGESKRVAQLCIALGQFAPPVQRDEAIHGTNLGDKPHINIPLPVATKRVPMQSSDRGQSIGSVSDIPGFDNRVSNEFSQSDTQAIHWFDIASNIIDVQSAVPSLQESLIDKLRNLSSDSKSPDIPDLGSLQDDNQFDSVYGLISSISRYILPDAVIDFDWVENGSWHLLSLHHSDAGFECFIDGEPRPVLPWSLESPTEVAPTEEAALIRPVPIKPSAGASFSSTALLGGIGSESVSVFGHSPTKAPITDNNSVVQKVSLKVYPKLQATDQVHVGVGFTQVEKEYKDQILDQVETGATNASQALSKLSEEYLTVLQCHEVVVGGLAADVGEVCFLDGGIDRDAVRNCFAMGPDAGVKSIRGLVLVSLDIPSLVKEGQVSDSVTGDVRDNLTKSGEQAAVKMASPRVTLVSSHDTVANSPKRDSGTVFSFFGGSSASAPPPASTSSAATPKAGNPDKNASKTQVAATGSFIKPSVRLGSALNVQRHDTTLLSTAVAQLGGLKLLYPLLLCDLPRQTATLQFLADIVASSSKMFDEFSKAQADKVILYCCQKTALSRSLDAMQTIFDLVCPPSKTDHDAILPSRKIFLSLLLDVSLSCPFQPLTARAIVDWLKGVCDDVTENTKFVLDGFGIYPFLILLSLWSPNDASKRFLTVNPAAVTGSTTNESNASPIGGSASAAAIVVDEATASGGPSKLSKLVVPSRSSTSINTQVDLSSASFDELSVASAFAPVGITTRPTVRSHSAFSSELSNKHDLFKLNAEKSRLQLSCGIFIKQLMTGTSGHEPIYQPQPGHLTPFHTQTGFTINHFTALLNFLHFCYQKLEEHDEKLKNNGTTPRKQAADISVRTSRKTVSRNSNNINSTTKNVMAIGSTFSMPIVSNVDKSDNWLLNAILIILDAIIGAAETSLAPTILDFLRIFQSNNSVWDLCLMLLGSEYSSIRYRAITLVTMSLTLTPNGIDPDPKSILNFEKANGFTIMAEQLSKFPNDEAIVNSLLSILFWRKGHSNPLNVHTSPIRISRTLSATNAAVATHKEDTNNLGQASPVGVPQAFPFALPSPSKLPTETSTRPKLTDQLSGNDLSVDDNRPGSGPGSLTKQDADKLLGRSTGNTNAGNSSMFSIFSWKNSSSNTPRFESPTPRERGNSHPPERSSPLNAAKKLLRGDSSTRAASPAPRLEVPRGQVLSSDASQVSGDTTLPSQSTVPAVSDPSHQSDSAVQGGIEVETIVVPQAFPVLLAALQTCRSLDIIQAAIKALILALDASARAPSRQKPVSQAAIDRAARNVEILYSSCKDWIVNICQAIQYKRDKILGLDTPAPTSAGSGESADRDYDSDAGPHTRDRMHSIASLSETESLGGDHYMSDLGSEDDRESVGRSLYGDSAIDCSASVRSYGSRSLHGSRRKYNSVTLEQLESLCSKFVEPFYLLLETLLILDLKQRPTPARRWVEIFRLSAPEYEDTQRVILFDLMKSFDNFSFNQRYHSLDMVLNYFRNYASLLDQILYKSDLSLEYSVLVIKAIHAMTYKCPPDVRAKLKETGLSEVRNTYIVQCLMDCFDSHSRDLYSRATALCEINSPLQGYMTSTETKLLSSSHVVLYVLSIFVEGAEELEAASNIELNFAVSGDTNALIHRVQMLVDSMYFIIAIVQSCVIISPECKAMVTKLCKSILGDKDEYLLKVLLKSEPLFLPSSLPSAGLVSGKKVSGKSDPVPIPSAIVSDATAVGSTGDVEGPNASLAPLVPPASPSAATAASWWGSWSSTAAASATNSAGESNSPKPTMPTRSPIPGRDSNPGNPTVPSASTPVHPATDGSVIKPDDIPLFLDWFCAPEQKAVFEEFKTRVIREIKPVLRKTEKIHERNTQRKIKHIRGEMERVMKDKLAVEKLIREGRERMKKTSDRCISTFVQDSKVCMDGVVANLDTGRVELKKALQVLLLIH